jgi:hypothetical protein
MRCCAAALLPGPRDCSRSRFAMEPVHLARQAGHARLPRPCFALWLQLLPVGWTWPTNPEHVFSEVNPLIHFDAASGTRAFPLAAPSEILSGLKEKLVHELDPASLGDPARPSPDATLAFSPAWPVCYGSTWPPSPAPPQFPCAARKARPDLADLHPVGRPPPGPRSRGPGEQ